MKVLSEIDDSKVLKKLKKLSVEATLGVESAVANGASMVRNTMVDSMTQEAKHGRVYNVPGTRTKYVASAPGEAPAVATSNLISNIEIEFSERNLVAEVGVLEYAKVDYAAYLEFGTSKMAARPFLEPALKKHQKEISDTIKQEVKRVLKNG